MAATDLPAEIARSFAAGGSQYQPAQEITHVTARREATMPPGARRNTRRQRNSRRWRNTNTSGKDDRVSEEPEGPELDDPATRCKFVETGNQRAAALEQPAEQPGKHQHGRHGRQGVPGSPGWKTVHHRAVQYGDESTRTKPGMNHRSVRDKKTRRSLVAACNCRNPRGSTDQISRPIA